MKEKFRLKIEEKQIIDFNQSQLAEIGKKIYYEKLKSKLESTHKGKIVAINPETGDYFIGKSILDAVKKGKKKFPDAIFYSVKIGYPAVVKLRGILP